METVRNATGEHSIKLRAELKIWEKQFQDDNSGRKAGRDDIKANPIIAAKYKEFQKVRDILAGKTALQHTPTKQKRPRTTSHQHDFPTKRPRSAHDTPRKGDSLTSALQEEDGNPNTPAIRRTMIGPTPQKDGIVLGIFDHVPTATPSRNRSALIEVQPNVLATPSKPTDQVLDSPQYEERARGSRTPASTGKRFLLDCFVTPQKRKLEEQSTPSSSIKQFATPTFLRRDNFVMSTIEEVPSTPQAAQPWKRRSFGRSLSGMIKDMRKDQEKQQEEQADEELELLRELEEDADPRSRLDKSVPSIVVEDTIASDCLDSQLAVVLDRDGFVPSDIEQSESEKEQPGMPVRKPWKKKGLKRTTRRVIMRPVTKKAQATGQSNVASDDEDETVAETQLQADVPSDIEGEDPELDSEQESTLKKPKKSKKPLNTKNNKSKEAPTEEAKSNKRKTKATAHANYRALKIKNKNSKGKGGGRFGRRR